MAPRLSESNIALNCLCPGLVASNMTGPVVSKLPKDKLTPQASIIKAWDRFLDSEETGCVAEISGDNIYLVEHRKYVDELQEWVCVNFSRLFGDLLGSKP